MRKGTITRRQLLGGLVGLAAGATCIRYWPRLTAHEAPNQPNILLIVADDLGYGDVGCYGGSIPTPHLDALAARGRRFTQGYATAPVCAPSRAGLLTGRYPWRYGLTDNPKPPVAATWGLPPDEPTLAEHLSAAGYRCGMFGKWHLGFGPGRQPQDRGFHTACQYEQGDSRSATWPDTDQIRADALRFIAETAGPSLAYVSFNAPHWPIEPPTPEGYARIVQDMDAAVGALTAAAPPDTLTIFLSDNGAPDHYPSAPGVPGLGSNAPWPGWKGELTEGGIRVPYTLTWPGHVEPGVDDRLISSVDVVPTCLAAAGLTGPENLDGINLLPPAAEHAALFWRFREQRAVRIRRDQDEDGPGPEVLP